MLGVSFDSTAENKAFKEKFDFPYELLSDVDKAASIKFGAAEMSSSKASRVSVLIGPDGKVVKVYDKVTPAEHPEQVLADLAAL